MTRMRILKIDEDQIPKAVAVVVEFTDECQIRFEGLTVTVCKCVLKLHQGIINLLLKLRLQFDHTRAVTTLRA